MKKATRGQVREHNRQLVLRSIFTGAAASRAALAQETSLTKPAISDLVEMLISEGFLTEEGFGESTEIGGKRPRLLRFVPDARQVIGLWLDQTAIVGVLTHLDGHIIATHAVDIPANPAQGDFSVQYDLVPRIVGVINGLTAQADAPILCIGIAVAGVVDSKGVLVYTTRVGSPRFPLGDTLAKRYNVPVYTGNSGELAALAMYMRRHKFKHRDPVSDDNERLVTLTIGEGVSVGAVLESAAHLLGSEIGFLNIDEERRTISLDGLLGWHNVVKRAQILAHEHKSPYLHADTISYLHIRSAVEQNDFAALLLYDELAARTAQICAWVIALLRPDYVAITGAISDLGERFLRNVTDHLAMMPELVERITFAIDNTQNLAALGAASRAIQMELGLV